LQRVREEQSAEMNRALAGMDAGLRPEDDEGAPPQVAAGEGAKP
jgi:hypothetical protein